MFEIISRFFSQVYLNVLMHAFIQSFNRLIKNVIDDFRGACAVKGNDAVAGHVKR